MATGALKTPSRIAGPGALLRSLRTLLRRVDRYGEHRATLAHERHWAAHLFDQLNVAYQDGLRSEAARASLQAYDRRRSIAQKTPHAQGGPNV